MSGITMIQTMILKEENSSHPIINIAHKPEPSKKDNEEHFVKPFKLSMSNISRTVK